MDIIDAGDDALSVRAFRALQTLIAEYTDDGIRPW